jgi:hypothetical protein
MVDDDLLRKALEKIAYHDTESARLKRWVNDGDMIAGNEPRFPDIAVEVVPGATLRASKATYLAGTFFNKPFASAVKTILTDRYEAAGKKPSPAAVDEIFEALAQGSFGFETTGADNQKNSIRISLGKNSVTFVKLPNSDLFGLVEWYGRPAPRRRARLILDDIIGDAEADDSASDTDPDGDEASPVETTPHINRRGY